MPIQKKFKNLESTTDQNTVVYPSNECTIEVIDTDGYSGAHKYRAKMCTGFSNGKTHYIKETDTIQFVQKNEDGTVTPGWQSEQLAIILLDRVRKLNARFPSEYNEKQAKGLEMYLEACKERIQERLERGVYGELKN